VNYHERIKRTYERAKDDDRFSEAVAFEAACLTNMAIAVEADAEVKVLRAALAAIAGVAPWPDPEMGFNDLARKALTTDYLEEANDG
jgi:hypothetical protein